MINFGKDNIYIEACDERGFLGGMLISKQSVTQEYSTYDLYQAHMFLAAMNYAKKMLYNLNKYLATAKDSVPRIIYALRLFEKMDIEAEPTMRVPSRLESTEDLLERYRRAYFTANPTNDSYLLSLEASAAEMLKAHASMKLLIDLDQKLLSYSGFMESVSMEDYKRDRRLEETFDVNHLRLLMKEYPNINFFSINDMDDMLNMYLKNRNGFRCVINPMNIVVIK